MILFFFLYSASLRCRSNIQNAAKDIKGLNLRGVHLQALKATPFYLFVKCLLEMPNDRVNKTKKHDTCIAEIVKRFNSNCFKFGQSDRKSVV